VFITLLHAQLFAPQNCAMVLGVCGLTPRQRSHRRLQPLVGSMVLALNEEYVDMAGTHALVVKDGDTLAVG
jgi:hypothetical protein